MPPLPENTSMLKGPPFKAILSKCFAERVVIDAETLPHHRGYVLVAVDHFSGYVFCEHVKTKKSEGVAMSLSRVIDSIEALVKKMPRTLEVTQSGGMRIHAVTQDGDEANDNARSLEEVRKLCKFNPVLLSRYRRV